MRASRSGVAGIDHAAGRGGAPATGRGRGRAQPHQVRARTSPAGIERRCRPGGQRRPPRRTARSAAGGRRRGRRRSRRRASAARAPPSVPVEVAAAARDAPARGTSRAGTPAPVISPMPTARRWRSRPARPRGNAARRISSRNVAPAQRPRQRRRAPSAADRQRRASRAVAAQAHQRRAPHALARRARAAARAASRGAAVVHRATRCARRATSRSTAAACRRTRSRRGSPAAPGSGPRSRTRAAARARPARRARRRGARGATVPQPSACQRARGGRRDRALEPGLPVAAVAHEHRAGGAAPRVAPERVVAGGALEQVGEAGAREVAARERALGEHRRAQRLAHAHARDPQLADPARAAGASVGRAHARDPHPQRAHVAQAELGAGSSPAARRNVRPATSTAVTSAAPVAVGQQLDAATSRGASKPISSQWRAAPSARSACHAVAGSPSKAANGRCSGNCE